MNHRHSPWAALVLIGSSLWLSGAPATLQVRVDRPGHAIPKTLWGIFFEDINLSADGGIYPELVRNRSFEDADEPDHWEIAGPGERPKPASIPQPR